MNNRCPGCAKLKAENAALKAKMEEKEALMRASKNAEVDVWMRQELGHHRYWCAAGFGGMSWSFAAPGHRERCEATRDWLEKVLGEDPKTDPWFERRRK